MTRPVSVVVLGEPDHDPLVAPLLERLGLTCSVRLVRTSAWAATPVSVGDRVWVDRTAVDVFVDRSGHIGYFSDDFTAEDAAFAEAESRAALLAILTHPGLRAVNRAETAWWFAPHPWPALRGLLATAGVAVTPLEVGTSTDGVPASDSRWLTWSGVEASIPPQGARAALMPAMVPARTSASLWFAGHLVDGVVGANSRRAVEVLGQRGIELVSVATDAEDRVVKAEPRPVVPDHLTAEVAAALAEVVAGAAVLR